VARAAADRREVPVSQTNDREPSRCTPLVIATLAAALATACAHKPPPARPIVPPTAAELPPPDAIPGTFAVRQKLTASSAKGGGSFEVVLQKQPGTLTLVGLTPYGSRAFLLVQKQGDVQFTSYVPRELPFPPTFMLLDIHRVLGRWIGPPLGAGERTDQVGDETIRERWQDGKLLERTFTNANGSPSNPPGTITVSYKGYGTSNLASNITLENRRLDYRIVIETVPLQ
jgi:hypothetical protein